MKKLSLYVFLGLMWCNVGIAEIKIFECIAVKDNSIYEKNTRLLDTKKGTYISIKKKNNSEIKYIINQIPGEIEDNHKFKKFKKWDRNRLHPFDQKLLNDFGVDDWLVLPFVTWGFPSSPYVHWEYPNNTDDSLILLESFESLVRGAEYRSRAHICKEEKNEKMSKKQFKKIKKKSITISAFELISDLSEEVESIPKDVAQRIIDKEQELNQKIKKTHGIDHSFTFENKAGNKISRNNEDSLWKKFWGTVGWVLYEYGDEILDLAIELKYGTSKQTQTPRMYCISQRVGKTMVQTSCRQR